jgi:hypothetical protein
MVTVKNMAGLHKVKVIPKDISLVKIDTEGYDLEVIRGMRLPLFGGGGGILGYGIPAR